MRDIFAQKLGAGDVQPAGAGEKPLDKIFATS